MSSIAGTYVNIVKYRTDRASYKKVRDEAKRLQRDFDGIMKGRGGYQEKEAPRRKPSSESSEQKKTAKWQAQRAYRTEKMLISLKGVTEQERQIYKTQLLQAKTANEFGIIQAKIRRDVSNNLSQQRKITAELNRQTVAAKRFNGSMNQLAGSVASVYTGIEVGSALISTGIGFEAINKTLLAVSDSTEQASENFDFVRETAMKFGGDIIDTGKQFGKVIASSRGKLELEEMKETFLGISEASVALGLSQDQVGRSFNAINQMLSKGQIYAEELRGQLGEHLPFAMQAMARATQEIGLIDKSIEDIGELEKQLNKLMEDGKLISKDVIPEFSRQLRKLAAGDLDAVNVALRENLNPQLGIAMNNLKLFGDVIFKGGVKDALFLATKGFNTLMEETKALGTYIGGFFSGVITGITFPFRMLGAAILDLRYIIKDTLGITNEQEESFLRLTSSVLGTVAGLALLYAGFKKLTGLGKTIKGAKQTAETIVDAIAGKDGKGGIFGKMRGTSPANPMFVYVVNSDSDMLDKAGGTPKNNRGNIKRNIAMLGTVGYGLSMIPNFSPIKFREAEQIKGVDVRTAPGVKDVINELKQWWFNKPPIEVSVRPDSNGFMYNVSTMVNGQITEAQDNMMRDAYQNMTQSDPN